MSYLFCRCTRSVSLVPPCYYAHLAAFRGRILVSDSLSDTESSVSSAAGPTNVCTLPFNHSFDGLKERKEGNTTASTCYFLSLPGMVLFLGDTDVVGCACQRLALKIYLNKVDTKKGYGVVQVEFAQTHVKLENRMFYI